MQTVSEDDVNTTSVIAQRCEECGREEVRYYTQQLRSADEGSTVFYECDCGHKYVSIMCVILEPMLMQSADGTPTTEWNATFSL